MTSRVEQLGFPDAFCFAEANPGIPFGALFKRIVAEHAAGEPPIAYIQFQCGYCDDADKRGMLREAVADCLVRKLRQYLRRGWRLGAHVKERHARVFSEWELPPTKDEQFAGSS